VFSKVKILRLGGFQCFSTPIVSSGAQKRGWGRRLQAYKAGGGYAI